MTKDDNSPANRASQVDAVRHLGRTLESEEERTYVPKTDQLSPQDQAASEGDLNVRTVSESGEAKPELGNATESEPLKTRLPGDTSSAPHTDIETDLGEDNNRPNKRRNAA